jgi:dolichol-phosphate mannosyltransferase
MRGSHVTVVSPVYDERENAVALVEQLEALSADLPYTLSILLVNDGSERHTTEILDRLAAERESVGVVHLSRNFGHQAALTAGIDEAKGQAVITMDSDLQHPVSLIPTLLEQWEAGADVVHTVRQGEQEGVFKRVTSAGYYGLMRAVSPTPIIPHAADFRLLDQSVVEVLRGMTSKALFLRGMAVWVGFRSAQVPFRVQPRRSGRTKYSLVKMVRLALDGLVSLSSIPLYVAFYMGAIVSALSFLYLAYVIGVFFFTDQAVPGWSSLMVAVLLLSGIQIVLMGVIGLYLGKVYDEVRGRPAYIVARRSGTVR